METWSVYLTIDDSNPTVGLWCKHCLLPSRISCPVLLLSPNGVSHAGEWSGCAYCDDEGEEDDPDTETYVVRH